LDKNTATAFQTQGPGHVPEKISGEIGYIGRRFYCKKAGSVEIIVFITFLGAFAVPTGKGKLKKISLRISSS